MGSCQELSDSKFEVVNPQTMHRETVAQDPGSADESCIFRRAQRAYMKELAYESDKYTPSPEEHSKSESLIALELLLNADYAFT